jgi:hypothetical protein
VDESAKTQADTKKPRHCRGFRQPENRVASLGEGINVSTPESQAPDGRRGALYIDGFNLYHPIHQTGMNFLKWACLTRLGQMLCQPEGLQLVKVVFCTAVPKHLPGSFGRHLTFNNAQAARGVLILKGHHVPADGTYSEKQSDINVALSLICDGEDDVYDSAFLLSADSDQVATAKFFAERFYPKGKRLFAAIPPGQTYPPDYKGLNVPRRNISTQMMERCVMPEQVEGSRGLINRPAEYAPPEGWVHPDARPTSKPPKPPKRGAWSKAVRG